MGIIILLAFLAIAVCACVVVAVVVGKNEPDLRIGWGIGAAVAAVIFLIVFLVEAFASVGVGDVGVPVTFGHAGGDMQPGIHFKAPWTNVVAVNVQTQQLAMTHQNGQETTVHSSDNVESNVDVSVLFSVNKEDANSLYRNIGVNYVTQVIKPSIRAALQDQAIKYSAVALTASARNAFTNGVQSQLSNELGPRGITIQAVLVREVDLPQNVANAVNAKAAAQQSAQAQTYVLQQAQRQVQIAQQQAAANTALSQSLTPNIICNNWVNAVAAGKIQGPFYTTPCNTSTSSSPTVLVPGK